jgi:hypothetical protein
MQRDGGGFAERLAAVVQPKVRRCGRRGGRSASPSAIGDTGQRRYAGRLVTAVREEDRDCEPRLWIGME